MSFEKVLNHGIDLTKNTVRNDDGNIDEKGMYSSNGYYIDDNVFDNFIRNRIAKFIKDGSSAIKNEQDISVGSISRDVMVISPAEAATPVSDEFQVLPFESDQLTTEHTSSFTDDQVPLLETDAELNGKTFIPKTGTVTLKDTITYDNLTPGLTYEVKGSLYDKETGKAIADQICVYDETIDESQPLTIFDQHNPWKRKTIENFTARELMVQVFKNGKLVYDLPDMKQIREYCMKEVDTLWDEVKRFENPHGYYVDLSQKLYDIKTELLYEGSNHKE